MRSSPQTIPPPPKFGYRSWQIPLKTKGKTPRGVPDGHKVPTIRSSEVWQIVCLLGVTGRDDNCVTIHMRDSFAWAGARVGAEPRPYLDAEPTDISRIPQ